MMLLMRGHLLAGRSDLLVLVIVVLLLLWAFGGYRNPYYESYGPRGYGIGWVIVVIVILLLFFGNPF